MSLGLQGKLLGRMDWLKSPAVGQTVSSTTQNLLALEGTPVHANATSGTSMNIGPFTTTKAAQLFIFNTMNGTAITISSITGGGLIWTNRVKNTNLGANSPIEVWTAAAASALSGVTFTINYSVATTFSTADVFAFSGNNTSTIFDANVSVPASGASSADVFISTDNANDVIAAGYRFSATASPTQGAGWIVISGADFQLTEYKIVSATQSNLDATIGTGSSDGRVGVADAVMSA